MRIIAGEWRGRKLEAPPGLHTRPTADRTRERLFSMLESRMNGFTELRVLDLFAGTGALGLEALSRNAGFATFVEQDRAAAQTLRRNIATLGAEERAEIIRRSALTLPPAEKPYDLVLLDPPYGQRLVEQSLVHLRDKGWFTEYAWIAAETGRDEPVEVDGFETETRRASGKAMLHILRPKARRYW